MYDLSTVRFTAGQHKTREDGMCIMEAAAWIAGEPHTDHPKCACPVIGQFCRAWNDGLPSDDERSKWMGEFVWRLPGTRDEAFQKQRAEMATVWLFRTFLPEFLRLSFPDGHVFADALDSLSEMIPGPNSPEYDVAFVASNSLEYKGPNRRDPRNAIAAAGGTGAYWTANCGSAAAISAHSAAEKAASVAGAAELEEVVERTKPSARDLLDRMIRLTEPQEAEVRNTAAAACLEREAARGAFPARAG